MLTRSPPVSSAAVIGAGPAGLALARRLATAGVSVTVVEKSRGIGGRLATRRVALSGGEISFDHGCPSIHLTDRWPEAVSGGLRDSDRVALWVDGRTVGVPGMSSLLKPLADGLTLHRGVTVSRVERDGGSWRLIVANGVPLGPFDWVLSTAPAPQSAAILSGHGGISETVSAATMAPRWSLMLVPDGSLGAHDQVVELPDDPVLERLIRNDLKPGRTGPEAWVVHCRTAWSAANLEMDRERARDAILSAVRRRIPQGYPLYVAANRWRYAEVVTPLGVPFVLEDGFRLGAAGDWCLGPSVADAVAAASQLADRVLESTPQPISA